MARLNLLMQVTALTSQIANAETAKHKRQLAEQLVLTLVQLEKLEN